MDDSTRNNSLLKLRFYLTLFFIVAQILLLLRPEQLYFITVSFKQCLSYAEYFFYFGKADLKALQNWINFDELDQIRWIYESRTKKELLTMLKHC